ncbi:hypothetical protein GBF38_004937 [Nibea albiflora]|uniref:Uncharacterized protein n=1 Tax=Nibea albiflora TaxID=240163 RepID=A0ACB7EVU3_NIBAL|nr:hypothetical protein GBF38_004937 [Nibea albiflora]
MQRDMSVNSSNSFFTSLIDNCRLYPASIYTFTSLFIIYILLLPLFILVLYVGCQRWRRQRSVATATTTSHSDVFTLNMVVLELLGILGFCIFCISAYINLPNGMSYGLYVYFIIAPGQTLFHLLTCVDRYLAVVHPVTYLRLRQAGGVRIRNVSIGCVWFVCLVSLGLSLLSDTFYIVYTFLLLVFSSVAVSFCSLSILRILIRPGPGEVGGNRRQVDQSKQRAFHTISVIMAVLLLRFISTLISKVTYSASGVTIADCLMMWSIAWFSLPSSLVLPLLFLHRAGKLPGCERSTASA